MRTNVNLVLMALKYKDLLFSNVFCKAAILAKIAVLLTTFLPTGKDVIYCY